MNDARDGSRDKTREHSERRRRPEDKGWRDRYVAHEIPRLKEEFRKHPDRGASSRDELQRLEEIRERSSMRRTKDFDPRKEKALEDKLYEISPHAEVRRDAGKGWCAAKERLQWKSIEDFEKRRRHPR